MLEIFISNNNIEKIKNKEVLKKEILTFFNTNQENIDAIRIYNLLSESDEKNGLITIKKSNLNFNWFNAFFPGINLLKYKLFTPFTIGFFVYFFVFICAAIGKFGILISIILYLASLYVFGKFYTYFLLKKFINYIEKNIEYKPSNSLATLGAILQIIGYCFLFLAFAIAISDLNRYAYY